jgi:hypothetical protein
MSQAPDASTYPTMSQNIWDLTSEFSKHKHHRLGLRCFQSNTINEQDQRYVYSLASSLATSARHVQKFHRNQIYFLRFSAGAE